MKDQMAQNIFLLTKKLFAVLKNYEFNAMKKTCL